MPLGKHFRVLCLVLILSVGGCATTGNDPSSRYSAGQLQQIGEKFMAAGDAGQAMKYLTLAEQKKPRDPVIMYDLGLAYNARGLQNEALPYFQKALAEKPDYAEAYNAIGTIYAERGQYTLASEAFKKALLNPYYSTPEIVYFNLGRLYEKQNDYEGALKQYQEAVRMHSNYGNAFYRMGIVLEALQRVDEARRAYGKAVEYTPDFVEAHLRYGILCFQAGQMEPASASLARVLKLAPNTTQSEEAKRYLDRIEPIPLGDPQQAPASRPSGRSSGVQPIDTHEIGRVESANPQGLPAASTSAGPAQGADRAGVQAEPLLTPQAGQPARYVVRIGSFVDRGKAEEMQAGLLKKGYPVLLRQAKDQALGTVYVLQLKPVDTLSKATTLMAQIEGEVQAKPSIVRISAK